MKKVISLNESELAKIIEKAVNSKLNEAPVMDDEDMEDDDPFTVRTFPVEDPYFELSDSDMLDIDTYRGPKRRFRGSIYIDYSVPQTDDIEYDRKVAKEVVDYFRKQLNVDSYTGGVGFRQGMQFDAEF
jgi:hypothetical protein